MSKNDNSLALLRAPSSLAVLLLTIAAARILRFDSIFLGHDEFWSIWQGYGEIVDVVRWTPFDWPPLYYVMLDLWISLVGIQSLALRYLSVLMFLVGAAFLYRVIRFHGGETSAWIGSLCFGGISYLVFLSTELRGYSLMLLLIPMTWYFALRLSKKPGWKSVSLFSLSATASLYTTYVAISPLFLIALNLIWCLRNSWRRNSRFVYVAAIFALVLCLPIPLYVLPVQLRRVSALTKVQLPPFVEAMEGIYRFWFGAGTIFLTLMILSAILVIISRRKISSISTVSFLWAFPFVPLFYLVNPYLGLFEVKYASWTLIGTAVFIGVALGHLPQWGKIIALGMSALLLLPSPPWQKYNADLVSQLEISLNWMQAEMYSGDQILLADDHECSDSVEIWNYMLRAKQPNGLSFADTTNGQPRIWFVTADGSPNSPHWEALRREYVERHFVGPPGCLFRLYERPPDGEGVLFSNGMRFQGAQFLRDGKALPPGFSPQLHEGERFQVRMWWQVEGALPQDYSVGTFLMDAEGRVIEEAHGPPEPSYPEGAPWETSRWQEGQIYYEDREMAVPYPLERQQLAMRMAVYFWEEPGVRFVAEGTDALGMLPVMQITIDSW